jgi:hypothetical protein
MGEQRIRKEDQKEKKKKKRKRKKEKGDVGGMRDNVTKLGTDTLKDVLSAPSRASLHVEGRSVSGLLGIFFPCLFFFFLFTQRRKIQFSVGCSIKTIS